MSYACCLISLGHQNHWPGLAGDRKRSSFAPEVAGPGEGGISVEIEEWLPKAALVQGQPRSFLASPPQNAHALAVSTEYIITSN